MSNELIIEKLERIERLLQGHQKTIFNVEELCEYTGFKKAYVYVLVHKGLIPYSKPNGKLLFFEKEEIDSWLLQNKSKSVGQIEQEAQRYFRKR